MAKDQVVAPNFRTLSSGTDRGGVLVNTAWVVPSESLAYWSAASREIYGPLALRCHDEAPFVGQIAGHSLGALALYRTDASPIAAARTARTVRAADEGFSLFLHLYGSGRVTAGNQNDIMRAGDLMLVDSQLPSQLDCEGDEPWGNLTLKIPGALVQPYADRLRKMTGVCLSGELGIGRLVRRFLVDLDDSLSHGQFGAEDMRVAESVLDLVLALCLQLKPQEVPRSGQGHDVLLRQVKSYIEQNLGDPELGPAKIAQAHFISLRLLYKLFEREEIGVSSWIRERRFERCRQDLIDPKLARDSIAQIAHRWGFTNSAHFSRFFRAMADISPREFRQEMLGDDQIGSTESRLDEILTGERWHLAGGTDQRDTGEGHVR